MTEKQDQKAEIVDQWMVRPCTIYEEEYKQCKSFRGRAHQKFVYGEKLDCQKWYDDWKSCVQYEKSGDTSHLANIIQNEMERRKKRLEAASANTVWEYRSSPPDQWTAPLPEDLRLQQRKTADRFLKYDEAGPDKPSKSSCTIL